MIATILVLIVTGAGLWWWYNTTRVIDTEATIRLQSQHDYFYFHVDLPDNIQVQAGDTVHIINVPDLDTGRTDAGEMTYHSPVKLYKASWLQRHLIRRSSLVEFTELIED